MSYTVFALKWRPQNFDEIVGQDHIVASLKGAIQKNRLANAYLFAGPRGVGKTSTARILAKALNCKDGPIINPCQNCPACREISQSRSLDVIEIDGASNRGIDEIRTLRENVKFAPVAGKFKIYIIDEVHMLTTEAFNALLKTLEEPPEFVKFIFATTQPHKVIPTILSRCQRFDFRRIPAMEIIRQLEKIAATERVEIDKDVLFAIAKSSDGSLRDAESVLDQLTSFSKDKISLRDVVSVLGLVEQETLFEITEKIINKEGRQALEILNQVIDEGKDISVFLTNLIEHFRNLMVAKVARASPKLIDLPEETCKRLLTQAEAFSLEEIFSAFNILINTQEMSKRLEFLRIPLEIGLVRLTHDKKSFGLRPQSVSPASKSSLETKPVPPKENPDYNYPQDNRVALNEKSLSLDEIKRSWQEAVNNVGKVKMYISTYLAESQPIKLENNILTISFPKNCLLHKETLEKKENKTMLEKIFADLFGVNLRINFILAKEVDDRQDRHSHPFIKSALEIFNGRIIKEE